MKLSAVKSQNTSTQALFILALFFSLVFLFLPHTMVGVNTFDEGFIASGAMLVRDGQLPYRDFLSVYGPAQYYLTAAIYSVLGEDLQYMRLLHVVILSAIGVSIYLICKIAGNSNSLSLIIFLCYAGIVLFAQPSVGYPAVTATLFLLLSSFGLVKWFDTFRAAPLVVASVLVGIAGLFRWDFGVFGLMAITLTTVIAIMKEARETDLPGSPPYWLLVSNLPGILILAAVYAVFLFVLSDPVRWYHEILVYSLTEFSEWRGTKFVRPAIWGLMQSRDAIDFGRSVLKLAYLGVPIALIVSAIGTAAYVFFRQDLVSEDRRRFILIIYLSFTSLLLLNQMRVRPHVWQGFSALAASLPLIPLLYSYHKDMVIGNRLLSIPIKTSAFILGALLLSSGLNSLIKSFDESLVQLATPRTNGVRVPQNQQSYIELIRYVENNTELNEPIFSGVVDHTRLFVNDAALYFLARRYPADRFLELEPGISNTAQGQNEIVNALKRKNVRLIVLKDIVGYEANRTSTSNGITLLDEFIRANYHLEKRFGKYLVFLKN